MLVVALYSAVAFACSSNQATDAGLILLHEFPDYELVYQAGTDESGALSGDFNGDGRADFAALLKRPTKPADLETIPERLHESLTEIGIAVVCQEAIVHKNDPIRFACTDLTKPSFSIPASEIQLVPKSAWLEHAEGQGEVSGNPDCASGVPISSVDPVLALVETIGHCDTFFYPGRDGEYRHCIYCAD